MGEELERQNNALEAAPWGVILTALLHKMRITSVTITTEDLKNAEAKDLDIQGFELRLIDADTDGDE